MKMFEGTRNGSIEDVLAHFEAKDVKGEIVIILGGKEQFVKDDVEL